MDIDAVKFPADLLRQWKADTEQYVRALVTQDARLRQLRDMVSLLLSRVRILNGLPGPGPSFDKTFEEGGISLTRIMIEVEQVLFENDFPTEADTVARMQRDLESLYKTIWENRPSEHLDITEWKNQTVRTLMIDVMRFKEESYARYCQGEGRMVERKLAELRHQRLPVRPFVLPAEG